LVLYEFGDISLVRLEVGVMQTVGVGSITTEVLNKIGLGSTRDEYLYERCLGKKREKLAKHEPPLVFVAFVQCIDNNNQIYAFNWLYDHFL
jgi:hypothetical protein